MKPTLPKDLDPKLWQTRDGREVIQLFYYPDNQAGSKIIAHIKNYEGSIFCTRLYENGCFFSDRDSEHNLIPKPRKVGGWFNFYARKDGGIDIGDLNSYSSEKEAKRMAINSSEYVATKYIEFEVQYE